MKNFANFGLGVKHNPQMSVYANTYFIAATANANTCGVQMKNYGNRDYILLLILFQIFFVKKAVS